MAKREHYFYGGPIFPEREARRIERALKKYRGEEPDEALKEKIWNELQELKHRGEVRIPFKVVMRKKKPFAYIEVLLDTKV